MSTTNEANLAENLGQQEKTLALFERLMKSFPAALPCDPPLMVRPLRDAVAAAGGLVVVIGTVEADVLAEIERHLQGPEGDRQVLDCLALSRVGLLAEIPL